MILFRRFCHKKSNGTTKFNLAACMSVMSLLLFSSPFMHRVSSSNVFASARKYFWAGGPFNTTLHVMVVAIITGDLNHEGSNMLGRVAGLWAG